jgi:hypothetical protein
MATISSPPGPYSKNNENVTCLRFLRKKFVTYENLRKLTKTYENLRKLTKTYENLRKLTKTYENLRKLTKTSTVSQEKSALSSSSLFFCTIVSFVKPSSPLKSPRDGFGSRETKSLPLSSGSFFDTFFSFFTPPPPKLDWRLF